MKFNILEYLQRSPVDIFCDTTIPDYVQANCGIETGGIPFVAVVALEEYEDDADLSATLENATWWTDNITGSPSTAFVVLNTRGSKAAGTPTEEEGFGFNAIINNGVDREIPFEAIGVVDNIDFWSAVNKTPSHVFIYGTTTKDADGDYVAFIANNASINTDVVIDQSIKSRIRIGGTAKYSTDGTLDRAFSFPASVIQTLQGS